MSVLSHGKPPLCTNCIDSYDVTSGKKGNTYYSFACNRFKNKCFRKLMHFKVSLHVHVTYSSLGVQTIVLASWIYSVFSNVNKTCSQTIACITTDKIFPLKCLTWFSQWNGLSTTFETNFWFRQSAKLILCWQNYRFVRRFCMHFDILKLKKVLRPSVIYLFINLFILSTKGCRGMGTIMTKL